MIVKVETRVNIGKRRQQESNIMKGISTTKLVSANNSNKVEQSCLQYINILYVIITLSLSQDIVSCLRVSRETTRDERKEGSRFS